MNSIFNRALHPWQMHWNRTLRFNRTSAVLYDLRYFSSVLWEVGMMRFFIFLIFWAQAVSTSQIGGTVKDQTGAVLPGAEVTATQTDTGAKRTVLSDETGSYILPNLPICPYRLEVGLPGFRTYVQTPSNYNTTGFQFAEDISMIRGAHQFGYGVNWIHSEMNGVSQLNATAPFTFNGQITLLGLADFMIGLPSALTQGSPSLGYYRLNYFG